MSHCFTAAIALIALTGCASFNTSNASKLTRDPPKFSQLESIRIEEMNSQKVLVLFGKPDEIFETRSGKELWAYREDVEGKPAPRLNLLIDPTTSALASVTWLPREGDAVYSREQMLTHFKNAKFSSRMEGMIARHYFSDDLIDEDIQKGLSIHTHGVHKTVMSVSWYTPKRKSLATQKQ